jgi:cysteine-rich repeat protein
VFLLVLAPTANGQLGRVGLQGGEPSLDGLDRKLAQEGTRGPVYSATDPRFQRRDPNKALSCATPCTSGTLTETTNLYYNVAVDCANGAFTARTGTDHPDGMHLNVIFGGDTLSTGTSDITFHVHNTADNYLDPIDGQTCAFDPPDTGFEPASYGLESEWIRTPMTGLDLVLREELVAFGDAPENSGIRMTLCVENMAWSTETARMGLRWQLDYQNGADFSSDDGPRYASVVCSPYTEGPFISVETEFQPSDIHEWFIQENDTGTPIHRTYTSTSPLAEFPGTWVPDRLVFGRWPSMNASGWMYVPTLGDPADSDSAVLYYYGYFPTRAVQVTPGQTQCRSLVILTQPICGVCGNGVLDPGEECDDGNPDVGDGCRPDCTEEVCGDGIVDPQEECDDGNSIPLDGCENDCTLTVLPVEFGDYRAVAGPRGVEVVWTTFQEVDAYAFEVYARRGDGTSVRLPGLTYATGSYSEYLLEDLSEAARSGRRVAYKVVEVTFSGPGDATPWFETQGLVRSSPSR